MFGFGSSHRANVTTGTREVSQIGAGGELERELADRRDGPDTRARAREILLMADTEPLGVGAEVNDQQVHASVLQSRRYGAPDPACRAG